MYFRFEMQPASVYPDIYYLEFSAPLSVLKQITAKAFVSSLIFLRFSYIF